MVKSITAALSPPSPFSGKLSEPRPFTPPSLVFFDYHQFLHLRIFSPLPTRILLYLLPSLLVVALPSMLFLVSLVAFVYLFMINSGGPRSQSPSRATSPHR